MEDLDFFDNLGDISSSWYMVIWPQMGASRVVLKMSVSKYWYKLFIYSWGYLDTIYTFIV